MLSISMKSLMCGVYITLMLALCPPAAESVVCTNSPLSRVPNVKHDTRPSGNAHMMPINVQLDMERQEKHRPDVEMSPPISRSTNDLDIEKMPLWQRILLGIL